MPTESTSDGVPAAPGYRVINYQVTNKELVGAIQKALEDVPEPEAKVFVGESPGREGWAILTFLVGKEYFPPKLVMFPSDSGDTNLITQRHRVMTWVRLEVLLEQVHKWIGKDARVSLMFNYIRREGVEP